MPTSPESAATAATTTASNQSSSSSSDDVIIDLSPLLSNNSLDPNPNPNRPNTNATRSSSSSTLRRGSQTLREAARFLRRASSRRMMREPSMLVREAAAEQLEERQTDWAYSRPVVVLDLIWNFAFVAAAAGVFIVSRDEHPIMPLRIWIVGYVMQCVLHMFCVVSEYRRRQGVRSPSRSGSGVVRRVDDVEGSSGEGSREYVSLSDFNEDTTSSVAKHLESANTMFSFIWWIIGFYWVSAGGTSLARDAPQLYWLCIIFLGFDVFFVVFCVALACVIGIAVCCCLPCIIAILYAVAEQEGASNEDIERLPKFKFRTVGNNGKPASDVQEPLGGIMTECGSTDSPIEHYLSQEDAECCICLSAYEDGVELMELPCRHHFHRTCVDKWLRINATCPLCKYNISKRVDDPEEV